MAWATPLYSRRKVDKAGECLVDPLATPEDRELALVVVNNWRSSHSFPLNTLQTGLRHMARRVDPDPLIAQRIKRLSSIEAKLQRFHGMDLARMQDLGGCRAVVKTVAAVDELDRLLNESRMKHELLKRDDYLRDDPGPQSSGYRGVHRVYRYYSDKNASHNGLRIEVQLRSRYQHAWATAVETAGTFIQQALKSSQGEEDWLRFFALMGSEVAIREKTATVPGTPTKRAAIRDELKKLCERLDIVRRLEQYGMALRTIEQNAEMFEKAKFFLLKLNAQEGTVTITAYAKKALEIASQEYEAIERVVTDDPGLDAVLVSVDSLANLRRAYPNYFADTTTFVTLVEAAVGQ